MPVKNNRQYHSFIEMRAADNEEFIVEGYATTFNDPYILMEMDGIKYMEEVDRRAFDNADMRDVIFQYNHDGMVYARIKNGTLSLSCDDHGLKVRADLSKTAQAREIYEAIKTGLVSEMSFGFTVEEDKYNNETHTRTILKIKKVYDVSAVSIPANPDTDISARSAIEGFIEAEKQEMLRAEYKNKQIQRIKILSMM